MPLDSSNHIDKLLRTVEYLHALAKVNTKTIRNLSEYQSILWFHEIPSESKYCFSRATGTAEEYNDDFWLEIKKFPEPKLPKVPEKCKNWVIPETLRDIKNIPELQQAISVRREEQDPETGETFIIIEKQTIQDRPDVQREWETYLDKQWLPWTDLYNRYNAVQKVYSKLFFIHQEQAKLGEQYELILGLGLLTWRVPSGHIVHRHLISAKASLEFEPHIGTFTLRPSIDDDQVEVEFDMLDIEAQPLNAKQLAEEGRKSLSDNVWDRPAVDSLLNAVANSLADSGQGEYYQDRLEPKNEVATVKPIVEYAPAIILRKRSLRGLEYMLARMRKQIEEGVELPHEFLDLCECLDGSGSIEENDTGSIELKEVSETYFPLPANEEQRRIIRTLNRQKGVLVQGPPGTGKSHTIANLICHLLATGNRVLVTAKTPRALQVLHDKLPEEIKPLCINLLGNGTAERESLEKSVAGILINIDRMHGADIAAQIQCLEQRIRENRAAKSETDKKLTAFRESETYEHAIAESAYTGTAAQIARRIKAETETFSWMEDEIAPDTTLPLSKEEINYICEAISGISQEDETELGCHIPDPTIDLPSPDKVKILVDQERKTKEKVTNNAGRLQTMEGHILQHADSKTIKDLAESLSQIAAEAESIRGKPFVWITQAVNDVLSDKDIQWNELLKLSTNTCENLRQTAKEIDAYDVAIQGEINRKELLHHANALWMHFQAGGGNGFWIFKPKALKEHGAHLETVKVDGADCANQVGLQKLIDYLTFEQRLDYLWSLWAGKAEKSNERFPLQLARIKDLQDALSSAIKLHSLKENATRHISMIKGLGNPHWANNHDLYDLVETCQAVLAHIELLSISKQIEEVEAQINIQVNQSNPHPILNQISEEFKKRAFDSYCHLLDQAHELRRKADILRGKRETINKVADVAPKLSNALTHCNDPQKWIERLKNLDIAWAWSRARFWIAEFLKGDTQSLERHSHYLGNEIRKDLGSLAAIKAWHFCISKMGQEQSRHLMAWQLAMKRYGKGTGKHAHTHRRNAQQHLNACRDSVPAWIMPLHRVYETVEAGPGIFEVIIVDEASQCGVEALPLLYLGKRILVVGDDKQISPEAVGIERGQVQRMMRDYLYDFAHADSFDVDSSLFDHARIRFSNRITLREHFRCMPEIINFSNNLCYLTNPLIPLRQYPPDRLEPIKLVHVPSGYREGDGQRVINRPEAEALANEVERCCRDERYQAMTMGVIVLQGEAQAYLIEELLLIRLGAEEMKERRLICGNPYSFQGDERDIIFLSMVSAPNARIGVLNQAADQRRFNVAASRAQDQMWLFHSATLNDLSQQCYRHMLLAYFNDPKSRIPPSIGEVDIEDLSIKALRASRMIERPPQPFDSWFEVDVALNIFGRGYRVLPQFEFADKKIDLVVQGTKAQLAVECDGDAWHGVSEYTADMERQRKLERCGWHFLRIRESHYYATPEKALEPLWAKLESMGIVPIAMENSASQVSEEVSEVTTYSEEPMDVELMDDNGDEVEETKPSRSAREQSAPLQGEESPITIDEALKARTDIFGRVIVKILQERPNSSCMRAKMAVYILKRWNIRTRGEPWQRFARKVDDIIAIMARKGYVTIYKSKNVRIKLGWEPYPGVNPVRDYTLIGKNL